ncbi:MAG: hypothetical protein KDD64_10290 [Bdellovibrionales bacterium]|nr:hypothetical protein [Bdellovibrionales bacterium]
MGFLQSSLEHDPTWQYAYMLVRQELPVPSHVYRLFRAGWIGESSSNDYMKVMSFSKLQPNCLLQASEVDMSNVSSGRGAIEHAISYLGARLSCVVLAVNFSTRLVLTKKPPIGWKSALGDMMRDLEIGYRFGAKAPDIGVEGGALAGFGRHIGLLLLMAAQPASFKKYQAILREKRKPTREEERAFFQCEVYQVAAFVIQQLGFGTEEALGIALSYSGLKTTSMDLDERVMRWKAASDWIGCLSDGRNYPADKQAKDFFPQLTPPKSGERNVSLEVLYTEIAKIRSHGSEWLWHLPKGSYDETREHYKLQ